MPVSQPVPPPHPCPAHLRMRPLAAAGAQPQLALAARQRPLLVVASHLAGRAQHAHHAQCLLA